MTRLMGPAGVIATTVGWATTPMERLRGLRGRSSIHPAEALILRPCFQVHTFGVRFPIDAVFCDEDMNVLHVSVLRPRRVSRFVRGAKLCVELASGRARLCEIAPGSRLLLDGGGR